MSPLILLIKPASAGCNMRCRYCFYTDTMENRTTASYGVMSLSTLENIVRKALAESSCQCMFAFQGGEPTLAGLGFYKAFIALVGRHNYKRLTVQYAIQTNGYCIDREWAVFLAEHHFLLGVSLDGIKNIHDQYRRDAARQGTFSKVMRATQLFDHYGVEYNILTVVTAQVAKNIGKIYGFFSRNHFLFQQYIPCLDPFYEERGQHDYSLTPELYGEFLCTLFDLWYNDFIRNKRVSIRYFDNLLQMVMGSPPESCGMAGHCMRQIVVEADGSVYPCDFPQIEAKRDSLGFMETSLSVSPQCRECQWQSLCRGGCRRDRESLLDSQLSLNYFCSSYKYFFAHTYSRLMKCARHITSFGVNMPMNRLER